MPIVKSHVPISLDKSDGKKTNMQFQIWHTRLLVATPLKFRLRISGFKLEASSRSALCQRALFQMPSGVAAQPAATGARRIYHFAQRLGIALQTAPPVPACAGGFEAGGVVAAQGALHVFHGFKQLLCCVLSNFLCNLLAHIAPCIVCLDCKKKQATARACLQAGFFPALAYLPLFA